MSKRLAQPSKPSGFTGETLRKIGWVCLLAGIVGKTILEHKLLGLVNPTFDEMMAVLESTDAYYKIALGAMILQIASTCALPVFAFLLVEGAKHTKCFWKYFLRVLIVALVSEIPYDLAYQGKWLDFSAQNPALGLVIALAMIFFFKSYAGKGFKSVVVAIIAVLFATLWADMLMIADGSAAVLIIAVLWLCRNKKGLQVLAGAGITCIVPGMNFLRFALAPLMFLLMHFYTEEKGEGNRFINYASYPFLLLAGWLAARFAF